MFGHQTSQAEFQKVPSEMIVFLQLDRLMQRITLKLRDTKLIDRLRFLGLRLTQVEHRQSTLEAQCSLLLCLSCRVSESNTG